MFGKDKEKEKEKEEKPKEEEVAVKPKETSFQTDFKAALRAGCPLVAVQTADPAIVLQQIMQITKQDGSNKDAPILSWDLAEGLRSWNDAGKEALTQFLSIIKVDAPSKLTDPAASIKAFKNLPPGREGKQGSIVVIFNAHRLMHARNLIPEAVISQALGNLRDDYKSSRRIIVLAAPSIILPPELVNDVLILDAPLPTIPELRNKVIELYEAAKIPITEQKLIDKAAEAVRGLSMFAAEQALAMSFTRESKGLNLEKLWHRKKKQIEQLPGLSIWAGNETYADVRGIETIKSFITDLFKGSAPPTGIVFLDELEKQLAGTGGDLSGVSQEMHGQFLSWMADNEIPGLLMVGHPGCSKSFISKATGGEFECPTLILSISNAKGGVVGQSTQQLRECLKSIIAICKPLVMATTNSVDSLSPELRSRFSLGTFFFEIPNSDERKSVWQLYIEKFNISSYCGVIPIDTDWTPREIRDCCNLAWRLRCSLKKASEFIIPVSKSAPERIEQLRRQASNRFLSASHPGIYNYQDKLFALEEQAMKNPKSVGQA